MTLRLGRVTTVFVSSRKWQEKSCRRTMQCALQSLDPRSCSRVGPQRGSMAWLPPCQRWRNLRRICKPSSLLHKKTRQLPVPSARKVQELMQYISDSTSKGLLVHVGRVAFSTTLNLISRTLDPQGIRRRSTKYFKRLHDIFDEHIDRRLHRERDGTTARNDFLDELLEHQVQGDGTKFDRQALKSLFSDIFVAGSDTSSRTVEWAMAELLRNPRTMVKVREEIGRVIGFARAVEEADIGSLPYLQATVKETMRLHPPVPLLLPRLAEATVELHGYEIPEGTRCSSMSGRSGETAARGRSRRSSCRRGS
ncbi:unnamed protein product [Musa acuminata subsp. burmannicoides]